MKKPSSLLLKMIRGNAPPGAALGKEVIQTPR